MADPPMNRTKLNGPYRYTNRRSWECSPTPTNAQIWYRIHGLARIMPQMTHSMMAVT